MKEKIGEVFSIRKDNAPVSGCTISKEVHGGENTITYFSLAMNTDISAEIYPYYKLIIVADGSVTVYGADNYQKRVEAGNSIVTLTDTPMGIRTSENAVYTEISIRREDSMNEAIKAGEVFRLAELVPYQDGKIVNMDVIHNDKMKFVVMAFDEGTGLSEHAAPGEALIFALDGEGVIGAGLLHHQRSAGFKTADRKAAGGIRHELAVCAAYDCAVRSLRSCSSPPEKQKRPESSFIPKTPAVNTLFVPFVASAVSSPSPRRAPALRGRWLQYAPAS